MGRFATLLLLAALSYGLLCAPRADALLVGVQWTPLYQEEEENSEHEQGMAPLELPIVGQSGAEIMRLEISKGEWYLPAKEGHVSGQEKLDHIFHVAASQGIPILPYI